ncbi:MULTISPECIES: RNA polymerase sigma factor FliA [Nitrosomonas]|uniref:RNA polymerase sigma factor FliA n=2 Tax=Nitrosomonas eutropha TaxID=916 RepID=A0ABX5M820_9PROT|nr:MULTISPECIES: RNA polymerase sigma factor FliA [Nitrosomonas]ABI60656.1 RNA polymerase, sigma 28 subunit, SigD/FliA/WhiG [Nitrosomonas eutropha C91]MXS80720.1 RNA polymerase sigma factor FliA [Nitrosomonas sp. GH22]PXV77285.1 RNA polymerase sigma-28 (SigD/FliA/WhiG) subunit [Nitrosomonas eutropha]SCX27130.1 RNA polymerase, sigma 28 subunit, SigD/FliA/WhiG [Nitrosomonas eutropha]SDX02951.1 RNA polymerase, sigma 28 subunit, SigD/FliA/WhiG [Nitrosomonas eutropha]
MYTEAGTIDKDQFVIEFTPLVKRIAYHMMARLPASVQVDDLIQAGMIGLLDAINRYEGSYGRQFESYAAQRIRGSMLDELREADWLPRSLRRKMRQIETAMRTLEQRLGCPPSEQEIADELNLPLAEYQEMLQEAGGGQLIYYEDFQVDEEDHFLDHLCNDQGNEPLDQLLEKNLRELLVAAIEKLPAKEKLVMGMYYEQEMNLREIGDVLGVSESRICQLHTQAISRLRTRLRDK